jgi:hypothetical protein
MGGEEEVSRVEEVVRQRVPRGPRGRVREIGGEKAPRLLRAKVAPQGAPRPKTLLVPAWGLAIGKEEANARPPGRREPPQNLMNGLSTATIG